MAIILNNIQSGYFGDTNAHTESSNVQVRTDLHIVGLSSNIQGNAGLYDYTHSKWIIESGSDGTLYYNGHAGLDLPLTGGTMTGNINFTSGAIFEDTPTTYTIIEKKRTINETDYWVDMGCGQNSGAGTVAFQLKDANKANIARCDIRADNIMSMNGGSFLGANFYPSSYTSGVYINQYGNLMTSSTLSSGTWQINNNGTQCIKLNWSDSSLNTHAIVPMANATYNLGTASTRWNAINCENVYAGNSDSAVHRLYARSANASGGISANSSTLGFWSETNSKWIIASTSTDVTTINGTTLKINGNIESNLYLSNPSGGWNEIKWYSSTAQEETGMGYDSSGNFRIWSYSAGGDLLRYLKDGSELYVGHSGTPTRFRGVLRCNASIQFNASGNNSVINAESKNFYFGTASGVSGWTSNLRGNTVRLYAHTSGAVYLGSSGTTAVTSDEQIKDIYEIDSKYEDFYDNLHPVVYKYTTPTAGKRPHMGFGARQVKEALENAGLETKDFAGILIDKNVDISEDEWGEEGGKHFDELYSLRYEEFIALNMMKIKKLEARIQQLESAAAAQGE